MDLKGRAPLHVVFGESAAGSVNEAFERIGRQERVIGLPDDLSFGPINPPDQELRRAWAKSVLRHDSDEDEQAADVFWAEATAPDVMPVAWVCATQAAEHAGFLEFAWRMQGRPFDIVDATHVEVPSKHGHDGVLRPWSLGIMTPEHILASGLIERRTGYSPDDAERTLETWRRLREENAPFRVVKDGHLVSAPLTYFDRFLETYAVCEWQKAAQLIGETMGRMAFDLHPPGQGPSDHVLFGRMLALGEVGVLDVEGSGSHMRDYRVRRRVRSELTIEPES